MLDSRVAGPAARAPTERDSPEIGAGPQQGWPAVLPATVLAVVVQRRKTPVLLVYIMPRPDDPP